MTTQSDPLAWRTLASRPAFRNRWLSVVVDDVELPNGRAYEYTRLEPGGVGVGIIGFDAAGQVLMEREYRHGVGQVIWQLPGGLAAAGEDLQTAGLRELLEETGYAPAAVTPATVRYLGAVWDNPAFGVAQSHIYAAWNLRPVEEPRPDAEESLTLHWQPVPWLQEAVRSGEIRDRFVIAAVAFLMLNGLVD